MLKPTKKPHHSREVALPNHYLTSRRIWGPSGRGTVYTINMVTLFLFLLLASLKAQHSSPWTTALTACAILFCSPFQFTLVLGSLSIRFLTDCLRDSLPRRLHSTAPSLGSSASRSRTGTWPQGRRPPLPAVRRSKHRCPPFRFVSWC